MTINVNLVFRYIRDSLSCTISVRTENTNARARARVCVCHNWSTEVEPRRYLSRRQISSGTSS